MASPWRPAVLGPQRELGLGMVRGTWNGKAWAGSAWTGKSWAASTWAKRPGRVPLVRQQSWADSSLAGKKLGLSPAAGRPAPGPARTGPARAGRQELGGRRLGATARAGRPDPFLGRAGRSHRREKRDGRDAGQADPRGPRRLGRERRSDRRRRRFGAQTPPAAGRHRLEPPAWVLVVMFGATEAFVLHVQLRRETQAISLSEIPLVLAPRRPSAAVDAARRLRRRPRGVPPGNRVSSCSTTSRCRPPRSPSPCGSSIGSSEGPHGALDLRAIAAVYLAVAGAAVLAGWALCTVLATRRLVSADLDELIDYLPRGHVVRRSGSSPPTRCRRGRRRPGPGSSSAACWRPTAPTVC